MAQGVQDEVDKPNGDLSLVEVCKLRTQHSLFIGIFGRSFAARVRHFLNPRKPLASSASAVVQVTSQQ